MQKQKSELLFEDVFDTCDIDNLSFDDNGKGLSDWDCSLLWYSCLHGITIGNCGGGIDTSACEALDKYC